MQIIWHFWPSCNLQLFIMIIQIALNIQFAGVALNVLWICWADMVVASNLSRIITPFSRNRKFLFHIEAMWFLCNPFHYRPLLPFSFLINPSPFFRPYPIIILELLSKAIYYDSPYHSRQTFPQNNFQIPTNKISPLFLQRIFPLFPGIKYSFIYLYRVRVRNSIPSKLCRKNTTKQ